MSPMVSPSLKDLRSCKKENKSVNSYKTEGRLRIHRHKDPFVKRNKHIEMVPFFRSVLTKTKYC